MGKYSKKISDSKLEINKWFYKASLKVCRVVLPLFVVHKIVGMENIPKDTPAILASKHTYWFDLITTNCFIDRTIYTFAKSAYFDTSTWGNRLRRWWFKKMGAFNVNNTKDKIGLRPSDIDLILQPIKKGALLLIYPEGTRVEGQVGKFEKGLAATIRIQSESELDFPGRLPIIPLSPAYSKRPFASIKSYIPFWRRIKIVLVAGSPIYYNGETTREFTKILKDKVTECYDKAGDYLVAHQNSLASNA